MSGVTLRLSIESGSRDFPRSSDGRGCNWRTDIDVIGRGGDVQW